MHVCARKEGIEVNSSRILLTIVEITSLAYMGVCMNVYSWHIVCTRGVDSIRCLVVVPVIQLRQSRR